MRLTVYTDYALRVLMYLAADPQPKPTIGEIAESYSISRNHLMKIVHELGVAGYIETVRGKGGGLRLKRPAETIGLGEIIRFAEADFNLVPCFPGAGGGCAITPACKLKGALHRAREAFMAVLDDYTLADLVSNADQLRDLLATPARAPT